MMTYTTDLMIANDAFLAVTLPYCSFRIESGCLRFFRKIDKFFISINIKDCEFIYLQMNDICTLAIKDKAATTFLTWRPGDKLAEALIKELQAQDIVGEPEIRDYEPKN